MVPYRLLSVRELANLGIETDPLSAACSQLPFFRTLESRTLALQIARLPSGVPRAEATLMSLVSHVPWSIGPLD